MTQYIFVSHSQKDIEKVRRVRDYLEGRSVEPILFNLKCLTDDDELSGLVQREIEARKGFLYLQSPNAQASARVRAEVSYARDMAKKHIYTVNLNSGWFVQKMSLNRMIRGLRGKANE